MNLDDYLEAASVLHEQKLSRSAKRLLDAASIKFKDRASWTKLNPIHDKINRAAMNLQPQIENKVFALTSFDGIGIVVPIETARNPQRSSWCDDDAMKAWEKARTIVIKKIIHKEQVPPDRITDPEPVVPHPFKIEGESCGLAAAIAVKSSFNKLDPPQPILATGALTRIGNVVSVGQWKAKIKAALEEIKGTNGIILVPQDCDYSGDDQDKIFRVQDLDEAFKIAFDRQLEEIVPKALGPYRRTSKNKINFAFVVVIVLLALSLFVAVKIIIPMFHSQSIQQLPKKYLPVVETNNYEEEIYKILVAYRGLQIAWETCHRDAYYDYFSEELDQYYNLEPAPLDFIKSRRDKRFDDDCRPTTGHANAAIQFLEINKKLAVITVCPSGSWKDGTCVDSKKEGPWQLTKILGYAKKDLKWKILFEFSGRDTPKYARRYDKYLGYKANPKGWIAVW